MDRNLAIIEKMLRYAEKVMRYTEGYDYTKFVENQPIVEACVFNISQLGELTRNMDKEYKDAHPDLPWHNIYNLRNRIVHDYEGIRLDVVWQVIYYHFPELYKQLEALLQGSRL